MKKQSIEMNILRFLLVFSIISIINLILKPPVKDWLIIFLLKGVLSSVLDTIVVKKGYIKYPVTLLKSVNISFGFDYLLYPIACVYYNQITKSSNILGILIKALYFSIPMAAIEHFLEKKTDLIEFKKGWTSFTSFWTLTVTFLFSRLIIALVRKADNNPVPEN
ncbi:CBO0543 family protein [Bacillus sp. UNC41MFS5]|uniref:CBO0543 family protein n=1 Tax=Bacillus sp. UNC41MFS5 TaxID=1449046 RepID=UPI000558E3C7|nr:CBO0543 family protein [Bacillus sp. UNC41MFS5]